MTKQKRKQKKEKKHIGLKICLSLLLLIGGMIAYSHYIAPILVTVNEKKLTNKTITDNFHGLKLVQFSDLHYGTTITKKQLEKIVKKINQTKPDIVVFTGDLIDESNKDTEKLEQDLIEQLSKIDTTLGKYMISGEEDHQFDSYIHIMETSGFKNLNNSYDKIYKETDDYLYIAGVDDTQNGDPDIEQAVPNIEEFNNAKYRIILLHEPDYIDNFINDYPFDLALAGHSHNGQIRLPFIPTPFYNPNGSKKYNKIHTKINNTQLYVSNGLGTSKIPFRLFNTPSITLYRLTNK